MFIQRERKDQTIHSRGSICSFLGLIAHLQLFVELNKLMLLFCYFLDAVYTLIQYFKPLATIDRLCHMLCVIVWLLSRGRGTTLPSVFRTVCLFVFLFV